MSLFSFPVDSLPRDLGTCRDSFGSFLLLQVRVTRMVHADGTLQVRGGTPMVYSTSGPSCRCCRAWRRCRCAWSATAATPTRSRSGCSSTPRLGRPPPLSATWTPADPTDPSPAPPRVSDSAARQS
eukprot:5020598-Pyramimonas_sp.AAC.2